MRMVRRILDVVINVFTIVALLAIVVAMVVTTWDGLGGRLFNAPLPGAVELATNLMPVICFGLLPYVQRERRHIRVEVVYANARTFVKLLLDLFNNLVVAAFMGLLAMQTWERAVTSFATGELANGAWRFPIYPSRYFIAVGAALFAVQMIIQSIEQIQSYRRGTFDSEESQAVDRELADVFDAMETPARSSAEGRA